MNKVCLSLGSALPGKSPEDAMALAQNLEVPVIGKISLDHVQICPQNFCGGAMTMERLQNLQSTYPDTHFRFHANVRLMDKGCQYDLGTLHRHSEYTEILTPFLTYLGQPYSIHAASNGSTLLLQVSNLRRLSEKSGVPVALEGLYPGCRSNTVSAWDDYAALLEHKVPYALDLSHLNIVRHTYGDAPDGLVEALMQDKHCIEVHTSGNDGLHDRHLSCDGHEWWLDLLHLVHKDAVLFYEGRIQ